MPEPVRIVVSDTGPFITLEKLPGGFELLRRLYDRVLLPQQVLAELAEGWPSGSTYLRRSPRGRPGRARPRRRNLR
jgi:predicted nucleic acid-binding protein